LLSKPGEEWQHSKPDVSSIRKTTSGKYLEPIIHEVKVRRADLLGDLEKPEKHQGYLAAAGQCVYVLAAGIAKREEIPECCGVMVEEGDELIIVRAAPMAEPFVPRVSTWISLAKATPYRSELYRGGMLF
jgi:hypothetical protein